MATTFGGRQTAKGFGVTISVTGGEKIASTLFGLERLPKDLTSEFKEIYKVFTDNWAKNFEVEGTEKKRWADLKLRTAEDRKAMGYGAWSPILERTGALKNAVTGKTAVGVSPVKEIQKQSARFGVKGAYVFALQYGRGNMKGRPFITIDRKSASGAIEVLRKSIRKAMR